MKLKYLLIALLFGTSLNLSAKDGVSFIHPFGELRVYFQDWLVVCYDKGAGECRMVNYVYRTDNSDRKSFFPDSRLSIIPTQHNKAGYIDLYDQGAPSSINALSISVDRKKFELDPADYATPEQNRIMETYMVKNETKFNEIVTLSKPARWLTVDYTGISGEAKKVQFSLMGFTKALGFIEKQTSK